VAELLAIHNARSLLELIRLSELARAIGVGPHTIRRWVKDGNFPPPIFISDGGAARWRVRDIDAWLEKAKRKRRKRPPPQGALKRKRLTDGAAS
jgi:predicted DNA-binding transcriptional regulator AlpA